MRFFIALIAWTSIVLMAACQSVKVSSNWNPNVDFTALTTWNFAPPPAPSPITGSVNQDSFYRSRVEYAIKQDLASKGFQQVPDGAPASFQVAFHHVVNSEMSISKLNSYAGYGDIGWNTGAGSEPPVGSGYGLSEDPFVDHYMQDTLFIDITTQRGSNLIWRGSGATNRGKSYGSKPQQEVVDNRVTKIMADFPPTGNRKK